MSRSPQNRPPQNRNPQSGNTSSSRAARHAAENPVLGVKQYVIVALTIATALIHFVLAFDFTFILNGLGYLALLGGLYLPLAFLAPYRTYIRWALMLYAAVTIILWAVLSGTESGMIGYVTKAIEVALIVMLWLEGGDEK
ncbi:MAG: hypothetical protein WDZ49_07005 [Litorilinea sp.]